MARFCIVLTRAAADLIRGSTSWGYVTIGMSDADPTGVVRAVSDGNGNRRPVAVDKTHYLSVADSHPNCVWHRVPAEVNVQWVLNSAQQTMITFEGFAECIPTGLRQPGDSSYYAITHAVDAQDRYSGFPVPEFVAWHVSRGGARPIDIDVEPERSGTALLEPHWPVATLAGARVLVVGAGSIGGAAVLALASTGIGALDLLDPDRLRWHNLPRHVCGPKHVGRLKLRRCPSSWGRSGRRPPSASMRATP
ncbi:ThiF family adenylyltransferase [Actinokineospora sp. NPDC004072]